MRNLKKVMRYIITPVIFALLGYMFIIVALSPVIRLTEAVGGMLVKDSAPDFNTELSIVYDPDAHKKVASQEIPFSQIQFPSKGEQYANLSCEEIGLDAPLYWGDTNTILKYGVGQYTGSFIPGYGKLLFLAAHNTTYFNCLQNAAEGQIVTITTNYGVFEYEIYKLEVINAKEADKQYQTWVKGTEEILMMYTCYPFENAYGFKTDRLFVFARKLSGPVLV
ncbi:MAG: class D sortase [Eubacteriales bacterium]|nr:class D sortase [Eubacteriales bacterium]